MRRVVSLDVGFLYLEAKIWRYETGNFGSGHKIARIAIGRSKNASNTLANVILLNFCTHDAEKAFSFWVKET